MTTSIEKPAVKPVRTIPLPPQPTNRGLVFLHALAFVFGFTLVFTLLGSAVGLFGQRLTVYEDALQRLGAILLVIFGLTTLGVFRWLSSRIRQSANLLFNPAAAALVSVLEFFNTLLYSEIRVTEMHRVNRNWGFLSSMLLGISFSVGWVPCIGPMLASIFVMASSSATAGEGAALLAIYSLGLGIPFLIAGAAFSTVTPFLRRLNRHAHIVSIVSGVFLIFVAYLLWTNSLIDLTSRFTSLTNWLLDLEYAVVDPSNAESTVNNLSLVGGAPLAFFAGLISFLSPCVLPLVPAYIGFLSSAAVGSGGSQE